MPGAGRGSHQRALPDDEAGRRREGHVVNRKRVQRIYREEKLMMRRRGGRMGLLLRVPHHKT